ncbi:MAG: hypothetical protein HY537_08460 [Deltaproteobacteria bacterium]|nr:hypothetical protein [Deltaproteobacteria bacterium]
MLLYRVTQSFKNYQVEYAIAGGWAVALHGAVRGTVDIDIVLLLTKENLERAERALNSIGLQSRLPVTASDLIDFREEYIRNKRLLAWRFMNPLDHTEIVDLLIVVDLRKLRTKKVKVGQQRIPVVSKIDLIRMKKASGRPQDLEDIKALETIKK